MVDKTGNPTCITIFSAPNYCGQYGNLGAIFCSRPDSVDVLTFEESQAKPIVFQMDQWNEQLGENVMVERVDGISYCMDKLIGYTTQTILGMLMLGNDNLSKVLTKTGSSDVNYLREVTLQSIKQDPEYANVDH